MPTLVKFSRDWADEFQAEGLAILTADQVEALIEEVENGFREWDFGTNEGWEEGELDMSDFTFTPITDEEAEMLIRVIPALKVTEHSSKFNGKQLTWTTGGKVGIFPPVGEDD